MSHNTPLSDAPRLTQKFGRETTTILTQGDRTPPREHLRRGHIRIYESGVKIWISNSIIGAGRGRNRVNKLYKMTVVKDAPTKSKS